MSEWQPFNDPPSGKIMVELYFGNLVLRNQRGEPLQIEPWRDVRRSLAYWDGAAFCDLFTGHEQPEFWDSNPESRPTHWRALPPPPAPTVSARGEP